MALPMPNDDTVRRVRAAAGVTERGCRDAVQHLKQWLKLQPHLPHDFDEGRLERRYMWCKASLERTKTSLDLYYTVRAAVPEVLCNRDPGKPWFQQVTSVAYCVPLPKLTSDCQRVVVMGNLDPNPANYEFLDVIKLLFMIGDVRFSEDCCVADRYIIDMANIGIGHIAKMTLPALKKLEVCAMKAYSARIKGIHYVNVPSYADILINLTRSILKPKIAARIHVHSKGVESLHDFVDRSILPEEYGGDAGSTKELWNSWTKKLESYREWFLEQDNFKADESKRPGKAIESSDLFGFEGSFRQLSLD